MSLPSATLTARKVAIDTYRENVVYLRRDCPVMPDVDVRDRQVVLVDDMISTGRTLAEAARTLTKAGAARVDVAATHALFSEDAGRALQAAGVRRIWTTDSVRHATNAIRLAGPLAHALRARR